MGAGAAHHSIDAGMDALYNVEERGEDEVKKKLIIILLAGCLITTALPVNAGATQPIECSNPFVDVAGDAYYHDAVLWALYCGITGGTGEAAFSPESVCTRAQVVTFLWRALGCPAAPTGDSPFYDVSAGEYYYEPVLWAVSAGVTSGTGEHTFSPEDMCTSAQVLTFLWRANGEPEAAIEGALAKEYPERYYTAALAWAEEAGLLAGTGDAFSPDALSPRSAIVTYLYRDAGSPAVIELESFTPAAVPDFSGLAYAEVNGNRPYFSAEDMTTLPFEEYSGLDTLGRCGVAFANVCAEIMPTEERGEIGSVKPTGWQTVRYDFIDGNYLYNRCHLIAFQLAGDNANERNLITGTRYLNIEGMPVFENRVGDYVRATGNHVLYRVTPIFQGDELVVRGVLMEGLSVEDNGAGLCFCVFAYNVQPGVVIDYATGNNSAEEIVAPTPPPVPAPTTGAKYILNTNTGKFHLPYCSSAALIKHQNRQEFNGSREELIAMGYDPCGRCHP